ncbi:MAG: carboxypeptidase regulatory-like domain-containing protein [Deltaproteobacteria bacterium]|nr:carboxypeptidase regulatory-like domain-containing protein [Deltaproteobacteria bacterium]
MIRRCGLVLTGMLVLSVWNAQAALLGFPTSPGRGKGSHASGSSGAEETGVWVSGTVRQVDGSPAAGVTVWIWPSVRPADGGGYREVRADELGRYRVALPEGTWRIAPCGSPAGYVPAYWDVTVEKGRVVAFLQVDRADPRIHRTDPVMTAQGFRGGEWIVLEGEGFGCSGRVWVELEDGQRIEVTDLAEHTDERVRFRFPKIQGTASVDGAWFSFVMGQARAGPVWVGRAEAQSPQGTLREATAPEKDTGFQQIGGGTLGEPLPAGATDALSGPKPLPQAGDAKKKIE